MDIGWWATETVKRVRDDGIEGFRWGIEKAYHKVLQTSSVFRPNGEPIWESEWDILVVVDACRYDLMEEIQGEYDFIETIDEFRSVNSLTRLWMAENFDERYADRMRETVYISGNPWSEGMIDDALFADVEHVWEYAWCDPGTVPPEPITDEVIRRHREDNPSKTIAHYMQPHAPFLPNPDLGPEKQLERFGNQLTGDIWDALKRGEYSRDVVWEGYRDNLRRVLNDVERLLRNVDAERVVITSDHGNALGEWGIYGHPPNMPLDCLRRVPLIETSAEDTGEPIQSKREYEEDIDRKEQLRSLGYL